MAGDGVGAAGITPLILIMFAAEYHRLKQQRWPEAMAVVNDQKHRGYVNVVAEVLLSNDAAWIGKGSDTIKR